MDGFAVPLIGFFLFLTWLLVEIIRGSFEDPVPRKAGIVWAVTCPLTGALFALGLGVLGMVTGAISLLALGSLGYWFLSTEADDTDDEAEEPVEPDPGPSDDIALPDWAVRQPDPGPDWDEFDRMRLEWEKEFAPAPQREAEPERIPVGV